MDTLLDQKFSRKGEGKSEADGNIHKKDEKHGQKLLCFGGNTIEDAVATGEKITGGKGQQLYDSHIHNHVSYPTYGGARDGTNYGKRHSVQHNAQTGTLNMLNVQNIGRGHFV